MSGWRAWPASRSKQSMSGTPRGRSGRRDEASGLDSASTCTAVGLRRPTAPLGLTTSPEPTTLQVIDWAQLQAGDRLTYAVALVYDDAEVGRLNAGHGRGLVWLVGMDGNTTALDAGEASTLHRRLRRRTRRVGIPTGDTMPPGVPDPFDDGTR